jgi:hypothetical protein
MKIKMIKLIAIFSILFVSYTECSTLEQNLQESKFEGLLAYANGYNSIANSLLKHYISNSEVKQEDWKIYVIYYLVKRDIGDCNFSPINNKHKITIVEKQWSDLIKDLENSCVN